MNAEYVVNGLLGACLGDALGVPVEFSTRWERDRDPVVDMRSYGTYYQPRGTWSDDSSLMLCLADALCGGFDLEQIAAKFLAWYAENLWTARGTVFDIGIATRRALMKLEAGNSPLTSGGTDEYSNGNGGLMRTLPLAFHYWRHRDQQRLLEEVHQVCGITHAHPRSQLACGIYVFFAIQLQQGMAPMRAYEATIAWANTTYNHDSFAAELHHFERILSGKLPHLDRGAIASGGYVVHTLEASLWCLLNSQSYLEAVLKAVNLGGDTDTTATVTGGIAALAFGLGDVPADWWQTLARYKDIVALGQQLGQAISENPYPLRGVPIEYTDPTEPVALED
ncbi:MULTISPECIES: ADP-ribosylglycohydrolase family protein [unclassified Thermosynechococcus]|uniref:ADP-ribosylglycohydrolase family protein n=1 Tax=unclassified Thermosynechococcus TaxID=2622553 RepID=UPI002672D888|nr:MULTISPECIES: ADP-ribosylglycohydrolase family protein [unclassified Thermosynechococcus]WKT83084.1 ADP-ribosylglycohydrolase family protein [Thermosynechococcus sp. HY596]WNC62211.1 ADP-ribosylglycohydrolase family protein [Thermosynechococcus sp. HY591]WNC64765.1 ADP-ribosylglycohydrolase family protein [Thermosynechococcus sp. HY593]